MALEAPWEARAKELEAEEGIYADFVAFREWVDERWIWDSCERDTLDDAAWYSLCCELLVLAKDSASEAEND